MNSTFSEQLIQTAMARAQWFDFNSTIEDVIRRSSIESLRPLS
jgi:hypothetical protein